MHPSIRNDVLDHHLIPSFPTPRSLAWAVLLFAVLALGLAVGAGTPAGPATAPPVLAALCQAAHGNCGPPPPNNDPTKTSAVTVQHVYDPGSTNLAVEPDTGEDIDIDVYWNTAGLSGCAELHETATVRVDWDGTTHAWVLSNINLTANVIDIDICDVSALDCSSVSDDHSYGYKLIVDINDPSQGMTPHNLRQVVYTTTAVDDGSLLNLGSCSLGAGQTVNSQTWTATDNGSFECSYSCSATGPTMTIGY